MREGELIGQAAEQEMGREREEVVLDGQGVISQSDSADEPKLFVVFCVCNIPDPGHAQYTLGRCRRSDISLLLYAAVGRDDREKDATLVTVGELVQYTCEGGTTSDAVVQVSRASASGVVPGMQTADANVLNSYPPEQVLLRLVYLE